MQFTRSQDTLAEEPSPTFYAGRKLSEVAQVHTPGGFLSLPVAPPAHAHAVFDLFARIQDDRLRRVDTGQNLRMAPVVAADLDRCQPRSLRLDAKHGPLITAAKQRRDRHLNHIVRRTRSQGKLI